MHNAMVSRMLIRQGRRGIYLVRSRTLASRAAMGPKAFAAQEAKTKVQGGGASGPSTNMQMVNSYLLAMGSLLGGASFIHSLFKPDLSLPVDQAAEKLCGSSSSEGHAADAAAYEGLPPLDPMEGFIAAPSFSGPRAGHVFKMGPGGLGYYVDRGAKT